jgi:scyllo-inositol 2-dehydrogenase (NADP+)
MTLSSESPIGAGLLAYGMSGKLFHAPFLAAHPGFELRAAVERSQQRVAADYPGIVSYPSTEALLADPTIELVVVNTPNDTHHDLTRQALLAGKHVLVEKPVATTVAEWQELCTLARQQGCQLLAYQNRRWDTDFGAVRRVVESGQLGQLIEAHFRFDRFRPVLHTKVFKEDGRPGSGVIYDLGPHLLDQVIALFGKPLSFEKTVGRYRAHSQVDDFFTFQLHYPQGLTVWVTSSLLVADPGPAFILHGTQGSYKKDRTDPQETQLLAGIKPTDPAYGRERPGEEGYLTLADPAGQPLPPARDEAAPANYLGLFEAVYQAIRQGQPYPIREEELAWQLELITALALAS